MAKGVQSEKERIEQGTLNEYFILLEYTVDELNREIAANKPVNGE